MFLSYISRMEVSEELVQFGASLKSFNAYLGSLTKLALDDYLHGRANTTGRMRALPGSECTQLLTFGHSTFRLSDNENQVSTPALFTFGIYRDHTLSIHYSESPNHNIMNDLISIPSDLPKPIIFDWTPAVSSTYRDVDAPSTRLYDLYTTLTQDVMENDLCLSHLIGECVLRGKV